MSKSRLKRLSAQLESRSREELLAIIASLQARVEALEREVSRARLLMDRL